jgi:alkylhydroperoxidase family enzyme
MAVSRGPCDDQGVVLDGLRRHFFEEQVYDIIVITCLFNFMDRAADAFGVELDPVLLP